MLNTDRAQYSVFLLDRGLCKLPWTSGQYTVDSTLTATRTDDSVTEQNIACNTSHRDANFQSKMMATFADSVAELHVSRCDRERSSTSQSKYDPAVIV